ncbi:hypothetical protein AB0C06_18320 [Micromonospora inaquosa]|nr:hypothetical protein [Micromonospora inaquosa]
MLHIFVPTHRCLAAAVLDEDRNDEQAPPPAKGSRTSQQRTAKQ